MSVPGSRSLSPATRWALALSLVVFFIIQAVQLPLALFHGTGLWPFSPYTMFAFQPPPRSSRFHVVLHESSGRTQLVEPGNVLPIEFFRANALLRLTYSPGGDGRRQAELARVMLTRLRESPWEAFDEVRAAARPSPGAVFTRLDIVVCEWDLERYRYGAGYRPECAPPLFSYPSNEASVLP